MPEAEYCFCPECGVPAEVMDRFEMDSTAGPVEHVRIRCVNRHYFFGSTSTLIPSEATS